MYFVYEAGAAPNVEIERGKQLDEQRSDRAFAKAARRALPHYWADATGAYERELLENDRDEGDYVVSSAGAPWWDPEDESAFTLRYWYLRPFRHDGTTYFLAWAAPSPYSRHWYVVLRPEPSYRATEMCVFQIVRPWY